MRTGAYGSPTRRTYGAQGEKVNLAARLTQAAKEGILCDESVYQATQTRLVYESLPPIMLKGLQEPAAVFRPTGETKHLARKRTSLIGRTSEKIALGKSLRDIRRGRGKVILIEGESGIGKSRLVDLLQEFSKAYNVNSYSADGNIGDNNVPLQAWQDIIWQIYELHSLENETARVERLQACW